METSKWAEGREYLANFSKCLLACEVIPPATPRFRRRNITMSCWYRVTSALVVIDSLARRKSCKVWIRWLGGDIVRTEPMDGRTSELILGYFFSLCMTDEPDICPSDSQLFPSSRCGNPSFGSWKCEMKRWSFCTCELILMVRFV